MPPEQRGMMMMLGKVMHATEEAQRTGSMGDAMRTLICDQEIKGMAINGMEKAMDNLMPSPVKQQMSLRKARKEGEPDQPMSYHPFICSLNNGLIYAVLSGWAIWFV